MLKSFVFLIIRWLIMRLNAAFTKIECAIILCMQNACSKIETPHLMQVHEDKRDTFEKIFLALTTLMILEHTDFSEKLKENKC